MNSPDRKVVIRYGLIQIPGIVMAALVAWLLHRWLGLPAWAAAGIVLLWISKDIAMFFVTWKAYTGGGGDGRDAMIGLEGEAIEDLDPAGRVCVRGENWRARLRDEGDRIAPGEPVAVVAMEGLTLVVAPLSSPGDRGTAPGGP